MTQQSSRVFNDRYEIQRRIARGGMAEVYLAHDLLLDRPVALKVLFAELAADPNFVERFRREAQAAANLSHPNIVSIYDWGEEDGTYFIVMEYVDGPSLAAVIREEGSIPPARAATIAGDVAAALAFAHRNGVVHRDVKPGNVLIDRSGNVKVTDFGIARAVNAQDNLTQTGTVMGTATYFSPEQAQGYGVDNRTDIYSLGIVLYEMLTGQPPFTGENPVSVAYRHVREDPAPPRELNGTIPAGIETIVLQALAKQPDERYATAEEFRSDLIRFSRGRAVAARPPSPVADATATMAATTVQSRASATGAMTQVQPTVPPEQPNRTGIYVALLIGMLTLLGVLLYFLGRSLGVFGETATTPVEVPNLIGETREGAENALRQLGLAMQVEEDFNRDQPAGRIFDQDPDPGGRQTEGGTVTVRISLGPRQVQVPNVVGQTQAAATSNLEGQGFVVRVSTQASDEPAGRVLDQDPDAGASLAEGSDVRILVSEARPTRAVADVVNLTENDAVQRLQADGFLTRRQTENSDTVEEGRVIRTNPTAGTQAERGATVTIVVSQGPENVEVPDVVGSTEQAATARLQSAGFRVEVERRNTGTLAQDGRVLAQSPEGDTRAPRGSTVTITVGNFSN